ncbi:hypothetical protein [Magnetovibrio sp.]|uniref:hypothetical protein n=1 Tax=Magnetovibrio sp. TaxID=2024836 RepID=UPI002F955E8D
MLSRLAKSMRVAAVPAAASVLAAVALSGCTTFLTNTSEAFLEECINDRLDIVENVDWSTVPSNRMRIVDNNFRPMVMYLEKGRPYSLTVENADPVVHDIWAPGLFKHGVALESVQIGDKTPAKGCVNGVRIEPRSTVTLRFVPVWEGRYEFRDSILALMPGQYADGVFHIVEPRLGLAVN